MKNLTNKGFTLVEMMVALLITGIMMILVMQFVFAQMKGFKREQLVSDTQQNLRAVMDEMARDIRMAGAGIPHVPIYTGNALEPIQGITAAPTPVYPLYIASGALPFNGAGSILTVNTNNTAINDSIIIIYKDPDRPNADTFLTADMALITDPITVPATAITNNTGFENGVPFIITNASDTSSISFGTKADLFMVTGTAGTTLQINAGGANNEKVYNAQPGHATNFATGGYPQGSRIFAVKVIRYDFSPDIANFPITKIQNNDSARGTDNAIGEFFGSGRKNAATATSTIFPIKTAAGVDINDTSNQAMIIDYLPFYGTMPATPFRGMSNIVDPYNISIVRITLTARTGVTQNTFGNNSLIRTRTMTTDIQPRNYNGQ